MKKIILLTNVFIFLFLFSFNGGLAYASFEEKNKDITTKEEYQKKYKRIYNQEGGIDMYQDSKTGQKIPYIINGGLLPGPEVSLDGETHFTKKLLPGITNGLLVFLLSISVITFIIGGIMYLTAQGDTEQTKKAFDTIFWSVVGLSIAILSFAAIKFFIGINFTP